MADLKSALEAEGAAKVQLEEDLSAVQAKMEEITADRQRMARLLTDTEEALKLR